jgi:hypothetical protein
MTSDPKRYLVDPAAVEAMNKATATFWAKQCCLDGEHVREVTRFQHRDGRVMWLAHFVAVPA